MSNLTEMMTNIEKYLSPYIITSGKQRQSVGFITLNQNVVSPDDVTSQVSNIADQRGAGSCRIIALYEPGSNSTLQLYR
ncbi:Protein of uncharacterised function (DUF1471) [Serratia plymuthica]|nr:Protein of uncharacterised function (DUF1471) [Serratia plymuthica]